MSDEDAENCTRITTDPTHNSLYKSVDLKPGHIYEVVIKNNDPKSVLTWDFDVVKSDLHFTVFRTAKPVSNLNGKNYIKKIKVKKCNVFFFLDPSTSVFDLSGFEEDKNYFRAEPSLVCHSKESVQVTFFFFFFH